MRLWYSVKSAMVIWLLFYFVCPSPGETKKKDTDSASSTSLSRILNKFQTLWDQTQSYQARFHQVIYSKALGTRDEVVGMLRVRKPDRLRWEGEDGNTEILNGKKLTVIQKNRRTGGNSVDIYKDVSKQMDTKGLSFLVGNAKLRDLYHCVLGEEKGQMVEVKLKPKGTASETYIAKINKESYVLASLTTDTIDTRIVLNLLEIKRGIQLEDKLFDYRPLDSDIVRINP